MARRNFAGGKLAKDAERLRALDAASPPEAKPCLMEVVRTLSDFIQTRAKLGYTDQMIADLLTEAGYPISAGTLRSYRKRLRDEVDQPVTGKNSQPLAKPGSLDPTKSVTSLSPAAHVAQKPPSIRADPPATSSGKFAVHQKNLPNERA